MTMLTTSPECEYLNIALTRKIIDFWSLQFNTAQLKLEKQFLEMTQEIKIIKEQFK